MPYEKVRLPIHLGTTLITAPQTVYPWVADRKVDITAFKLLNAGNLAASLTDYFSAALKNGSTTIATINTVTTAMTTGIARSATITASAKRVASGDVLSVAITKTGAGQVTTDLVAQIEADPVE